MDSSSQSWEADYVRRGRLWGGTVPFLPVFIPGSRILELGCGDGKSLLALRERGWEPTGLDFSRHATWLCRQNSGREPVDRVITADARVTPFKNNSFDVILATHIIGHMNIEGRTMAAGEIFRLLSPGGTLIFCGFSTRDLRYGAGENVEDGTFMRGNGIITHYFSREDTVALFSSLTPVSVMYHQWPMRVRGKTLQRSEIHGLFIKTPDIKEEQKRDRVL
jgi:ubiquinone/menaquinone biosynthesis C-methylase UbiE